MLCVRACVFGLRLSLSAASRSLALHAAQLVQARTALSAALLDGLRSVLGDRVSTAATVVHAHGKDESYHPVVPPEAVCFPSSTEEVAQVC